MARDTQHIIERQHRGLRHSRQPGWIVISVLLLALVACDRPAPAPMPDADTDRQAERISPYQSLGPARIAAMPMPEDDPELASAVAEAQSTLHTARERWQEHDTAAQQRWAIKWAAATVEGPTEHLWVRPTSWTAHRIEGMLLNPPTRELLAGRAVGEVVSFSTSDVTDWIYFESDDSDASYKGGHTVRIIEARAGQTTSPTDR